MLPVPKRIETEELLDEHDAPYGDMVRSLEDLRRINRYAGGFRVYRRLLRRVLRPGGDTPSILDVGTGTSDLFAALKRPLRSIGLDFKIDHLLEGRKHNPSVRRLAGNAFELPLRDSSVDVVTSSHFFHHFSPDDNVKILTEALRVCRTAVVVNDTRRHYAPLLFVQLLGALNLVGRITRFDAPASVRQGYTVREAEQIASRVPASQREVVRVLPFRVGIILWK